MAERKNIGISAEMHARLSEALKTYVKDVYRFSPNIGEFTEQVLDEALREIEQKSAAQKGKKAS